MFLIPGAIFASVAALGRLRNEGQRNLTWNMVLASTIYFGTLLVETYFLSEKLGAQSLLFGLAFMAMGVFTVWWLIALFGTRTTADQK